MPDNCDAKILQVLRRQAREDKLVDLVLAECRLILCEAEPPQPISDVHGGAMARFVVRDSAIVVNNVAIEILGHLTLSEIRGSSLVQNALGGVWCGAKGLDIVGNDFEGQPRPLYSPPLGPRQFPNENDKS